MTSIVIPSGARNLLFVFVDEGSGAACLPKAGLLRSSLKVAATPGFLPYEILFGERPPMLTDFLDDAVSVSTNQKATRKVVRITAEEFLVEV